MADNFFLKELIPFIGSSILSLTLLYIVIARSVCDVPAHRSAVLWHAGVVISERDSFASLGMTHGRFFVGQYTSFYGNSFHTPRVELIE